MNRRVLLALSLAACDDSQARTAGSSEGVSGGDSDSADSVVSSPAAPAVQATTIRLEPLAERFRSPVYLTSPPGDARLFVVEQAGRIRVVRNGIAAAQPFLDISERVRSGGEQGLLSMAFHPDYARNGFFFVNFTDRQGDTRVERFRVGTSPDVAEGSSSRLLFTVDQPYSNHNGGHILFGADGMLYVGTGDGGSGGDPHRHGQNRQSLLGKMLRVDVNAAAARPEIWAIGLRNPWRFAFDRTAGNLYIADVGQSSQEEINIAPARQATVNYGWNVMEGTQCYRDSGCDRSGLHIPQVTYGRDGGACSITGGFVYRGRHVPAIAGHYFYSDYCAGFLRSFRFANGSVTDRREWKMDDIGNVVSFGEDSAGELYIVAESGRIYRIAGAI